MLPLFAVISMISVEPMGWSLLSSNTGYNVGTDTRTKRTGAHSGVLYSTEVNNEGWSQLLQVLSSTAYRGQRVRFRAYLKTENVFGRAGLFMRIEGDKTTLPLAWDNMQDRPIRGSNGWQRVAVVLDVPPQAQRIVFGALLTGRGRVWIDDASFETVDMSVPVTDAGNRWPHPRHPENMDFELQEAPLDPSPEEVSIQLVAPPKRRSNM